jgi:O-antigen/teichoic acid export membrane protein
MALRDGTEYESCRRLRLTTSSAFLLYEVLIILKSRCCVALAGLMLGSESAGLYAAMERIAEVSILGSQSLSMVLAPQFAALYASGRFHEMRRLVRLGEILGLAFTIPVALAVACAGEYVLALFGDDYRGGWTVLMTLLGSAVIAACSGPGAYVLHMTGWERTNLLITCACTVTNLVLSFMLMPSMGVVGLGVAQMATSAVWMIGVRVCLRRHPAWAKTASTD